MRQFPEIIKVAPNWEFSLKSTGGNRKGVKMANKHDFSLSIRTPYTACLQVIYNMAAESGMHLSFSIQ